VIVDVVGRGVQVRGPSSGQTVGAAAERAPPAGRRDDWANAGDDGSARLTTRAMASARTCSAERVIGREQECDTPSTSVQHPSGEPPTCGQTRSRVTPTGMPQNLPHCVLRGFPAPPAGMFRPASALRGSITGHYGIAAGCEILNTKVCSTDCETRFSPMDAGRKRIRGSACRTASAKPCTFASITPNVCGSA